MFRHLIDTMRLSIAAALTLLLTPLVASESLPLFGHRQQALGNVNDKSSQVPGESPLEYCQDNKEDILVIEHVNLTPNPPVP